MLQKTLIERLEQATAGVALSAAALFWDNCPISDRFHERPWHSRALVLSVFDQFFQTPRTEINRLGRKSG